MARALRTKQAREDVLDIWEYIARDNRDAADRLVRRLDETIKLLAEQPGLGAPQDRFRAGLRCMSVGSYLIFYESVQRGILVLRILHGARRWEDLLN